MKAMKALVLFLFSAMFFAPFCAAGEKTRVRDMAGREVTVPRSPERIICIGPGTLRLIVYLGAQSRLVGIEDVEKRFPFTRPYFAAHNQLGRLPSIGPGGPGSINKEPDLEKVLAVRPEVIFAGYMDGETADAVQQKIGIPLVVLTYGPFGRFDEVVFDSLRVAAHILQREERAEAVVEFINEARQDLLNRTADIPEDRKPTAYIGGIGFKGSHGIESTETSYAPFEWLGAVNVAAAGDKEGHLFVDKERLLSWNPEYIFIDSGGKDLVRRDIAKKPSFYAGLRAFQQKKVYNLYAFNWYMTNLGTVILDAYTAGKILYPERFRDIIPTEKADEIYSFLLGRPVYRQMEKVYGRIGEALDFP